jgi:GDP-4-dehydro-6-deoxy-D-mannose reductase
MRVLITGAGGFVGPYLAMSLRKVVPDAELLATGKTACNHPVLGEIGILDVTDRKAVDTVIRHYRPERVVHLAGIAASLAANAHPEAAWCVHVRGTLNVANSILANIPNCWLLLVSSGMIYGGSAISGLPLNERALLDPADDYAVTKAAADLALGGLARRGLKCLRMRPFNHTGPGQGEAFVVPSFAMQIALIEAGRHPPIIRVGNLDAERDLLDVRDVATAYALATKNADHFAAGSIINIAGGVAYRVRDLLQRLVAFSDVEITIEQDAARRRRIDLPRIVGDAALARHLLDWSPMYTIEDTLREVLADCRVRVSSMQGDS